MKKSEQGGRPGGPSYPVFVPGQAEKTSAQQFELLNLCRTRLFGNPAQKNLKGEKLVPSCDQTFSVTHVFPFGCGQAEAHLRTMARRLFNKGSKKGPLAISAKGRAFFQTKFSRL